MNKSELKKVISGGEDSRLQFKADLRNADGLAAEMVGAAWSMSVPVRSAGYAPVIHTLNICK